MLPASRAVVVDRLARIEASDAGAVELLGTGGDPLADGRRLAPRLRRPLTAGFVEQFGEGFGTPDLMGWTTPAPA